MIRLTQQKVDEIIKEDNPYFDLTTKLLGIEEKEGSLTYYTRDNCVLAGSNAVTQVMDVIGCEIVERSVDGTKLNAQDEFYTVRGNAAQLHEAWKICLNIFDRCSGIATKTAEIVNEAKKGNPTCEIYTTRKSVPGAKDLMITGILAGGAIPHRLGLSETVLVFDQHLEFCGGLEEFIKKLPDIQSHASEKKIIVEAGLEDAVKLTKAGVDGIQFDKVSANDIEHILPELKKINPQITLLAAGGVNAKNAQEYAATGVDGIVTTAPFMAKAIDMSVKMEII